MVKPSKRRFWYIIVNLFITLPLLWLALSSYWLFFIISPFGYWRNLWDGCFGLVLVFGCEISCSVSQ
jgi:hypothetical protein